MLDQTFDEHGNYDVYMDDGKRIARAASVESMRQIVADHAAVPRLVGALTALRLAARFALSTPGFIRGRDELSRAVDVVLALTTTPPATGEKQ